MLYKSVEGASYSLPTSKYNVASYACPAQWWSVIHASGTDLVSPAGWEHLCGSFIRERTQDLEAIQSFPNIPPSRCGLCPAAGA